MTAGDVAANAAAIAALASVVAWASWPPSPRLKADAPSADRGLLHLSGDEWFDPDTGATLRLGADGRLADPSDGGARAPRAD